MKLILAFLIFGSVIAAGSAKLSCFTCKDIGKGVGNCQGDLQKCNNEGDYCGTQIENNILGDNIQTVKKSCMPKDQALLCNQQMILNTTDEFQLILYSKCCYEDGCNTEGIQMPPVNQAGNNYSCQSCFVENGLQCTEFKTTHCIGNQYQCLNFTGFAARPDQIFKQYAFQGCVTTGSCFVDLQSLPGSRVDKDANYTCSSAKFDGLQI